MKEDDILKPGDWALCWSPDGQENDTGFSLYTPKSFDPEEGGGPLGGLILAAVFFIMENGDGTFARELIAKANDLSREMAEKKKRGSSMKSPPGTTLN